METLPAPPLETNLPSGAGIDLVWEVTKLGAAQAITVNKTLIDAYTRRSSEVSIVRAAEGRLTRPMNRSGRISNNSRVTRQIAG